MSVGGNECNEKRPQLLSSRDTLRSETVQGYLGE